MQQKKSEFERAFSSRPLFHIDADEKGINVKIHGDVTAISMMLGLEMTRNPMLKHLMRITLESTEEMKEHYLSIAASTFVTYNNLQLIAHHLRIAKNQ